MTLEDGWAKLEATIHRLEDDVEHGMQRTFTSLDFANNYSVAFTLCTTLQNSTPELYNRYKQQLAKYCQEVVLVDIRKNHGEQLLECLYRRWEKYKLLGKILNCIFQYLDRFYTQRDRYTVNRAGADNPLPLKDLADSLFKVHVFDGIKDQVNGIILQFIRREREGEMVDRNMLKSAVEVFIVMGQNKLTLYETDFETIFLRDTAGYYKRLSQQWIATDSCPEYLTKCEDRIAQEMLRVDAYLHSTSGPKLNAVMNKELLAAHVTRLIEMENSGALALLHQNKSDDLARMYRMVSRLDDKDGVLPMCRYMKDHVIQIGLAAVAEQGKVQAADVAAFVDRLLEIQAKYTELVSKAFQKNQHFEQALKEAMAEFVNKQTDKNTTAQLIAVYVDEYLKEKAGQASEQEIDHRFDELLMLLHHYVERDLFQEFYRKQLAKRLLMGSTLNEDAEKSFVLKLKQKYGAAFTNRLEGMLTDHTMAGELQSDFNEHVQDPAHDIGGLGMEVLVLTQGYWPAYKFEDIGLPALMTNAMEKFKEFYCQRKKNRILTWIHTLGTASVNGKFSSRAAPVEIQVTTYQAVVLLLFNNGAALTRQQVCAETRLPPKEVDRLLTSLFAHKKYAVLKKSTEEDEIDEADTFTFNRELPVKTRHLKIPGATRLRDEEVAGVKKEVLQDRKYVIEAVIVRIMKARQRLTHAELVAEVIEQLKNFKPDNKMIKSRIEDLITRLYLKRDETNQNLYHYLA
eukprot:GAFH01000877.1.p2 GENE.GAFH01000877.1~~GAFH01000877.1.p2  ORF type:complete len:758 (-),score=373.48 GAFH01000877.1:226-2445(-)